MAVSSETNNMSQKEINNFRKNILNWYDKNRRVLPWRALSGETPDPYKVWLSEIMLQQTVVATVKSYFEKFTHIWPTVHDLAKADRDDVMKEWAGLGYYARARNLHKCAGVVSQEYNGIFPQDETGLKSLPGIGDYTSAAIQSIAFNKPANVVDGNIERIMARVFGIQKPLRDSKKEIKEKSAQFISNKMKRPGDYAQALMDLGATICTPKSSKCLLCPVKQYCLSFENNWQNDIPVKAPKKVKPQKEADVFWILNENNEVLLEKRPETEMLGGMIGLPTTPWAVKNSKKSSNNNNLKIYHSFTHFDLQLNIVKKRDENSTIKPENSQFWMSLSKIEDIGFPTLFKKVVSIAKD
ncbi:MAG: A/G-specific adenine glycosylase [Pseudomonadota bacterium]